MQKSRKPGPWGRPVKLSFFAYALRAASTAGLVPSQTTGGQSTRTLRQDRISWPDPGRDMAVDIKSILCIVFGFSIFVASNRADARPQRADFEISFQQTPNCSSLQLKGWSLEERRKNTYRLVLSQVIFRLVKFKLLVMGEVLKKIKGSLCGCKAKSLELHFHKIWVYTVIENWKIGFVFIVKGDCTERFFSFKKYRYNKA